MLPLVTALLLAPACSAARVVAPAVATAVPGASAPLVPAALTPGLGSGIAILGGPRSVLSLPACTDDSPSPAGSQNALGARGVLTETDGLDVAGRKLVRDALVTQRRLFRAYLAGGAAQAGALRVPEAIGIVHWMAVELARKRGELGAAAAERSRAVDALLEELSELERPEGPTYRSFVTAARTFSVLMSDMSSDPAALREALSPDYWSAVFLERRLLDPLERGLLYPVPQGLLDGIAPFVRVSGLPVNFIGLTTKPRSVDGIGNSSPKFMFEHDLSHAEVRAYNRQDLATSPPWSGLSPAERRRASAAIHRGIRRELSRIKDPLLRARAHELWFEMDHESAAPALDPGTHAQLLPGFAAPGRLEALQVISRAEAEAARRLGLDLDWRAVRERLESFGLPAEGWP